MNINIDINYQYYFIGLITVVGVSYILYKLLYKQIIFYMNVMKHEKDRSRYFDYCPTILGYPCGRPGCTLVSKDNPTLKMMTEQNREKLSNKK